MTAPARAHNAPAATATDVVVLHPAFVIAGRIMFTLIFFLSGLTHFTDLDSYVRLMPAAIPFRPFWVMISAAFELAGATMILLNFRPRLGAWLIVLFLLPVTAVVHGGLMVAATDPQMQRIQLSFFLKGITMAGAALLFTQLGVGTARAR
jgi:uncharacterized membrane protein YphA (DoxX/SURF4 family)